MVRVINIETGYVEHPHPMFRTWAEQIEWFANKHCPGIKDYVAMDSHGTAFCGRYVDNSPCSVILLSRELKVEL